MLDKKSVVIWLIILGLMSARWILVNINNYYKVHNAEVKDRVYNMCMLDGWAMPINDDYTDIIDLY